MPYNNSSMSLMVLFCFAVYCYCPGVLARPSKTCDIKDVKTVIGDLYSQLSHATNDKLTLVNPRDCLDIYNSGVRESGLYTVYLTNRLMPTTVYCDMSLPGGGWTVILKRQETTSPRVDFAKSWNEYVRGFGDFNTEFMMGLRQIHEMTIGTNTELFVGLQNHNKVSALFGVTNCQVYKYSRYSQFSLDGFKNDYKLNVGGFQEDQSTAGDSLTDHDGFPFTTHDRDNDRQRDSNCAHSHSGGWWYHDCRISQLTGKGYKEGDHTEVEDGIVWGSLHGKHYSLKAAVMAIRRRE